MDHGTLTDVAVWAGLGCLGTYGVLAFCRAWDTASKKINSMLSEISDLID